MPLQIVNVFHFIYATFEGPCFDFFCGQQSNRAKIRKQNLHIEFRSSKMIKMDQKKVCRLWEIYNFIIISISTEIRSNQGHNRIPPGGTIPPSIQGHENRRRTHRDVRPPHRPPEPLELGLSHVRRCDAPTGRHHPAAAGRQRHPTAGRCHPRERRKASPSRAENRRQGRPNGTVVKNWFGVFCRVYLTGLNIS